MTCQRSGSPQFAICYGMQIGPAEVAAQCQIVDAAVPCIQEGQVVTKIHVRLSN